MGLELYIFGIRKIRDEEVRELTGKTRQEMKKCKFYMELFPDASYFARYWHFSEDRLTDRDKSVMHMLTPVTDADGVTGYVFWVEELAHYWHKSDYGGERIDMMIEEVCDLDYMDWDQNFHVVPYDVIDCYTDRRPLLEDEDEEIVAFIYG